MARDEAYVRWKFDDNPDGKPFIAVADDSGRIVGQYALWPTKLRLDRSVIAGAQSLDTMTHPDYRGQGMFVRLAEACMDYAAREGIEALYGFPNENSFPGFVRRLDWDHTGNTSIWVRPIHPSSHHRISRWIGPVVDFGSTLMPVGSTRGFQVQSGCPGKADLESLIEIWRECGGRCRVEKTVERLIWRFSVHSGMRYRWISVYRGSKLAAIGVWGVDRRTGNAQLAEVLAVDARGADAVVSATVTEAKQSRCPFLIAASTRNDLKSSLRRSGFIRSGSIPLIVRKLTARSLPANVHSHDLWNIFGADLDTF